MLSHIDRELFPDRCEVVVLNDPQRYVYPIFKNGRSALLEHCIKNKCRMLLNEQISRANVIEIYLRDPLERFISGINTFCQMTLRDNPELDQKTVVWFAEKYFSLNRHYSTQFSWILNLARYTNDDCKFSLKHVDQLKKILKPVEPNGVKPVDASQHRRISDNRDLEMYTRLDASLVSLIEQDLALPQIFYKMKEQDRTAWNYIVTRNLNIFRCIAQG